ncbi:hypothetical protein GA0070624_4924 [Micromonospora rhizosphaerae]|uniref:Uncharacterized protein n=1 Tax=Micromonospora rhizosphaerae TaxID=568872 RepID=A0A1C6SY29_9ACTN|nr:hypothetical protein [Micromonospora rhizosphaerae]SCL34183.1 hypothetical protein GA0070624_4924 [Micromonospora rhizosphaerae]
MPNAGASGGTALDLRVGDLVEVRSAAEILAMLDENGELGSLPFMPEMLKYCGQRLTVYKVAHKTCDTLTRSGIRKMENAVHLTAARCDGGGHGGCQAACLLFWKHAWLRKVDPAEATAAVPVDELAETAGAATASADELAAPRLLPLLNANSRRPPAEDGAERYRCQATELLRAAPQVLPARDLTQYVEDVQTGNATVLWTIRTFLVMLYNRWQGFSVQHLPAWLRVRGGRRWGFLRGLAAGNTPTVSLGLQPGDLVRIRSREEIEPTLNADLLNRGMGFDSEMARFCGRTGRVARRVDHIIDETTGRMLRMKNPCIVLENVICEGAHNGNCPRAITPYWREIWLEKIVTDTGDGRTEAAPAVSVAE